MLDKQELDIRVVYYKFFKSYLKGRTYSLFDNDFSFKMMPNECTETDRNTQTDFFLNISETEEGSRRIASKSIRPEDDQGVKEI